MHLTKHHGLANDFLVVLDEVNGRVPLVDGALARLREGTFGECVSCGKEINAKRLEAVPWTRHCIECQEKAEQGLLETAL